VPHVANRELPTPFEFSSYGLRLHANASIPGLYDEAITSPADVKIWFGETPPELDRLMQTQEQWYVSSSLDTRGKPGLTIWKLANGAYFRLVYFDGNEFVVDASGTQVWVTWSDEGGLADAASYLLGPVLGFVLRLRGVTSLHASAICIGERTIAFVGPEGAGKSTTAAAFAARGYPIVADDIVALLNSPETFRAQSGCPRLRLWPTTVAALSGMDDSSPMSLPLDWGTRRYYLDLTRGGYKFERRALPLAAIYVLADRTADVSAPYVERVTGNDALMTLVANTYAAKLLDSARRAQEFELLNSLRNRVPLRRIHPHTSPDRLARLCDVIVQDFQMLRSDSTSMATVT
jgi:hypothetical protein